MTEGAPASQPGDAAKVVEIVRRIRIGMLTTLDHGGEFHARPVQTLEVEGIEALWFFTDWSSPKVDEVRADARVSVGYADPGSGAFVAVAGTARMLRDEERARRLWTPTQLAYYPDGPGDARLALLRVGIERVEYWIAPGRVSYLWAAAKAAATGAAAGVIGENRKLK
ncbi:MAG TPA: pyridoxamine 5'-phosphate oxidase family protein [Steroidobacteraceae bacterium]|nr:pyridoxamine 5'-phosphate oxidase family protein [Steroidobacteraceae bacterium]